MINSNHLHRRQPHSAVGKKRFHPAHMPVPALDDGSELGSSSQPALAARQFGDPPTDALPVTLPSTDPFPPSVPASVPEPSVPDPVGATSSILAPPTGTSQTPVIPSANVPTSSNSSSTLPAVPTTVTSFSGTPSRIDDATITATSSVMHSSSATAVASEATSQSAAKASSSTGPIVGGVVAGLIALGVLVIALVWFFCRRRKRDDFNDQSFDPAHFRRSAVLINDNSLNAEDGTSLSRGLSLYSNGQSAHNGKSGNPSPPSMIERKLAHTITPVGVSNYHAEYAPSELFVGAAYASTHGHGEYGVNHQTYNGEAAAYYSHGYQYQFPQPTQQQFHANTRGEPVDLNANPFQNHARAYSTQQPSPFSPPITQEPVHTPGPDAMNASGSTSPAVLVQMGGAPVLTRNMSTKSGRSGKSGKLSISIPANARVPNATVVNESAGLSVEDEDGYVAELPVLKRQPSSASSLGSSRLGSMRGNTSVRTVGVPPLPTSDYVDLSRSSVTPFQAAQYVEISKRINAEVPRGLSQVAIEEIVNSRDRDLPPLPPASPLPLPPADQDQDRRSPFADPSSHHQQGGGSRSSVDSAVSSTLGTATNDLSDFPIPPPSPLAYPSHDPSDSTSTPLSSPLPWETGKSRVNSMPPQLPEINIELSSRLSIDSKRDRDDMEIPVPGMMLNMGLGSAKDSPIYPSGITAGGSPMLGRFPVTPSPLGASFVLNTPNGQGVFGMQQQGAGVLVDSPVEKQGDEKVEKDRPVTVYDDEDAYGGM